MALLVPGSMCLVIEKLEDMFSLLSSSSSLLSENVFLINVLTGGVGQIKV